MKKLFLFLLLIASWICSFSQEVVAYKTLDSNGMPGKLRWDTVIVAPYIANYFLNGNKVFQKFDSTVWRTLSATAPVAYNNLTGVFSMAAASGSTNGYLTSGDWTTFNSKQSALSFTSPLVNTTGTVACATCVVSSSPGVGIAHFAGSTQTVTSSAVNLAGADVSGFLPIGKIVTATNADASHFLRGDGVWQIPSGGGGAGDSAYFWNLINGNVGSHTDLTYGLGTNTNTNLWLKTAGVNRLKIDSVGNIQGNGYPIGFMNDNSMAGANPTNTLQPNTFNLFFGSPNAYKIGLTSAYAMYFQVAGAKEFKFYQGTTAMPAKINTAGDFEAVSGRFTHGTGTAADPTNAVQNGTFALADGASNVAKIGVTAVRLAKNDMYFQIGATSGGGFRWYQGTTELASISQAGNVLVNTTTDVASSLLTLNSTTKGWLMPRMTKAQRTVITSGVLTTTLVAGSGYTNGTYTGVALTGGTGTGATVTLTVSGGAVQAGTVSFPAQGSGYVIGDVLSSASIGPGSGFTLTITALTGAVGLEIWQTDNTPGPRWYDGTNWNKVALTTD